MRVSVLSLLLPDIPSMVQVTSEYRLAVTVAVFPLTGPAVEVLFTGVPETVLVTETL